eukprot:5889015-Pleurochrysis_carterae.AAC.4
MRPRELLCCFVIACAAGVAHLLLRELLSAFLAFRRRHRTRAPQAEKPYVPFVDSFPFASALDASLRSTSALFV